MKGDGRQWCWFSGLALRMLLLTGGWREFVHRGSTTLIPPSLFQLSSPSLAAFPSRHLFLSFLVCWLSALPRCSPTFQLPTILPVAESRTLNPCSDGGENHHLAATQCHHICSPVLRRQICEPQPMESAHLFCIEISPISNLIIFLHLNCCVPL